MDQQQSQAPPQSKWVGPSGIAWFVQHVWEIIIYVNRACIPNLYQLHTTSTNFSVHPRSCSGNPRSIAIGDIKNHDDVYLCWSLSFSISLTPPPPAPQSICLDMWSGGSDSSLGPLLHWEGSILHLLSSTCHDRQLKVAKPPTSYQHKIYEWKGLWCSRENVMENVDASREEIASTLTSIPTSSVRRTSTISSLWLTTTPQRHQSFRKVCIMYDTLTSPIN